ncbi:MAG: hypothetical protein N3F66_01585 [Spirochaetes bacterium]|nr:hypothetical protein [Spirochaetota bacterium]
MLINDKIMGLSLEVRIAIIFGIIAFLISLLFGIIVGNKIGIVFTRVLFFTILYAGIGYASLLIIKRLVPEMYEILNQSFGFSRKNISQEENITVKPDESSNIKEGGVANQDYGAGTVSSETQDTTYSEAFTPLEAKDFTNLSTKDSKPKKMGKHIVLDDKKIQYEPKIMAEAIRTMLKRDKD